MIKIQERDTQKMPGLTSLFLSFDYNKEILDILHNLECKHYNDKTKEWEIPLSATAQLIDQLSKFDAINFSTKKDNVTYKKIKLHKHKTTPYKYQEEGVEYCLNKENCLLLDSMGLGKSAQAIYLAEELKKSKAIEHCLIICGVNNLKLNWKKQIEQHSFLDSVILGEKYRKNGTMYIGSIQDRVDHLNSKIKEFFIITNIETLRDARVITALEKSKNKINMIITDEIHVTKDPQSQQGKHFLKLNKADYKVGMTGTLLLNNPLDAYIPLKWIGAEKSSFTTFKYHYCTFGGKFHNILIGYKNLDLLKYQLNQCSIRRTKDILDLPPKNINIEYLEMNQEQADFYNNIKKGIIDEVDKVKITTTSLLAMVARLRQATACPSMLTSENIESSKIIRTMELVDELISNDNKVVIFSTFKETANVLAKKLEKYNPLLVTGDVKDTEASHSIDEFQNNPDKKVFIGTWQKCGTGITLTAASYMIFIDTP